MTYILETRTFVQTLSNCGLFDWLSEDKPHKTHGDFVLPWNLLLKKLQIIDVRSEPVRTLQRN